MPSDHRQHRKKFDARDLLLWGSVAFVIFALAALLGALVKIAVYALIAFILYRLSRWITRS